MIELIDLKQATITSIRAENRIDFLNSKRIGINSICVSLEINGFSKTFFIKGESALNILDYVKDIITNQEYE